MNHFRIAMTVLIGGTPLLSSAQKDTRPNIIHIMSDDHSFQTISAYGHPISKIAPTPNIDRLAKGGIIFAKAFVENSICAPSRATLLTGKYSHQHGQTTLGKGLDTTQIFFTELLHKAGYQTAVIGKWHLFCEPKGFDNYKILNEQGDYYNPEFKSPETGGKYVREEGYATTLITDHAIRWLDTRDKQKPFCLLLHHKAPHRNWMPEPKYLNLYENIEIPYPATLFDDYTTRTSAARTQEMSIAKDMTLSYDLKVDQLKDRDSVAWIKRDWDKAMVRMNPDQKAAWDAAYNPKNSAFINAKLSGEALVKWKYQRYLKDYLRCIKSLDDQIGRVLDYLEKEGLMENTIIVYTSDQGFYMGEHGWFDKRFMYEESFRTPLIVHYPKLVKAGSKCDDLVQNIDFAPTYLDLAGVSIPEDMAGVSLRTVISGKTPKNWRSDIYYHYYDYPAVHMVRKHDGVRTDKYKLIHFYGEGKAKDKGKDIDEWELFDMENDPLEQNNVYTNPDYNMVVESLKRRLGDYRKRLNVKE